MKADVKLSVDGARDGATDDGIPVIAPVEHWAEKRGMSRRLLAPIGEFERPNPRYQDYAQAKAHGNWPEDMQMTEADFDKAIADAKAHRFR